ncbi:MAG: efflux RND transporter periplasmic adaptor subunit, partial [Muribaculaceae bacterium]|nr:efflux RND transporter periplasmic adaptor subunit [Muribaculaceae bacterium]
RMNLAFAGNQDKSATAGMNVEVTIQMSDNGDSGLLVPSSALFTNDDKEYVWIMKNDSTVSAQPIVTEGGLYGGMVKVTEGLSSTDNVVRAGVSMLTSGEKVRVIEKPSKTNVGGLL